MDNHGALVGWSHTDLGEKLLLCLESVQTLEAAHSHAPDKFRLLMTRSQAAVLAKYLLRASGQPPPVRAGWFRRRFG